MRFKSKLIFVFLFSFCIAGLHAQSAEFMSQLLESKRVTYGQACYFTALYKGSIPESVSQQEAFDFINKTGYVYKDSVTADDFVTMADLSYLIVKAFNVKGGIMYSLFPSPRYALRLLESDGLVAQFTDPQGKIKGDDFIALFIRCLEYYDEAGAQ
ncbi:MAG: hypothetical protein K6E51_12680 [Treponema sp.]|nr:hypothetical protein [Treponema sp.]